MTTPGTPELPAGFLERPWERMIPVTAPAFVWAAVHGNLQLALRHPSNQGQSADILRDLVEELGHMLIDAGVMTPEELAASSPGEVDDDPACEVCKCTARRACEGGCEWSQLFADAGRAVCTRCINKAVPLGPRLLTPSDPEFGATLNAARSQP